jgi:mRNA degradation ribonuclease J1/J2
MDHFGMYKFQCHCSGHARSRDLLQIVDEINARTLYPVHSEHAHPNYTQSKGQFKKPGEYVCLVTAKVRNKPDHATNVTEFTVAA